jgi:ribosome maturation factor RimP
LVFFWFRLVLRKWGNPLLLLFSEIMTHPLIPQILELAQPVAHQLNLEVVGGIFHTNQSPPVLRIDIRNPQADTSLTDCEQMSRALELALDAADVLPDAYVLEISSPGLSRQLSTDRDFVSFRGFEVIVRGQDPEPTEWCGNLVRRDEQYLHLNLKGRPLKIPLAQIREVQLVDGGED